MSDKALLALGEALKANRGLETLNILMPSARAGVGVCRQFVLCLKENRHVTEPIMHISSRHVCRETEAVNETR